MNVPLQQYYPFASEPPRDYCQPGPSTGPYTLSYFETVQQRALQPPPPPQFYEPFPAEQHHSMSSAVVAPAIPSHPWEQVWNTKSVPHVPIPQSNQSLAVVSSSRFDELLQAKLAAERQRAAAGQPYSVPSSFNASIARLQREDIPPNVVFQAQQETQPVDVKPSIDSLNAASSADSQPYYYPVPDRKLSGQSDLSMQSAPESSMANIGASMPISPSNGMFGPAQNASTPCSSSCNHSGLQVPEQTPYWSSAPSTPSSNGPGLPSPYEQAVLVKYGVLPASATSAPVNTSAKYNGEQWQGAEQKWSQISEPSRSHRGSFEGAQGAQPFMWNVMAPGYSGMPASDPPSLSGSVDTHASNSPVTPIMANYPQVTPPDVKPMVSPLLSISSLPADDYKRYNANLYATMNRGIPAQPRFNTMSTDGQGGMSSGNGVYDSGSHSGDGLGSGNGGLDGSNLPNGLDFSYGGGGDGHGGNGEGNGEQPSQNPPKPKKLPLACHFCRRRKLKCDGIKPSCDNCGKRGVECIYDLYPRRRGPGKRTKEMRDRAAREAEAAGLINNNSMAANESDPAHVDIHELHHVSHDQDGVLDAHHDHSELILDPALADETSAGDLNIAMGALKRAGFNLGLSEDGDLGEPSTLAEISELHAEAQAQMQAEAEESAAVESMKRKVEEELENNKRIRLESGGESEVISVLPLEGVALETEQVGQ